MKTSHSNDLKSLLSLLRPYLQQDGLIALPVNGVYGSVFSSSIEKEKRQWHACFAVVLQGSKHIWLEHNAYELNAGQFTFTPIVLPVLSQILVNNPKQPFVALLIEYQPALLGDLANQIHTEATTSSVPFSSALFQGRAQENVWQTLIRLCQTFDDPLKAKVLGPLIIKELFFYLLTGDNGQAMWQFIRSNTKVHKITHIIHKIQSELSQEIDIEQLCQLANMSRSSFFEHFKNITAMSPIQYQKRLRLLEARKLLIERQETVESACYKVGYNSPSQFSREYSRMFGDTPARDTAKIKQRAI
ncbi:RCS-specific HTH-type transcriptional activator RclR [Thalassocella blandensis]|nr:RCS-specific HTH-type transcriptional activator RclR [Thalassocella blandensis]